MVPRAGFGFLEGKGLKDSESGTNSESRDNSGWEKDGTGSSHMVGAPQGDSEGFMNH